MKRNQDNENIRIKVLVPLAITMAVLLAFAIYSLDWVQRYYLEEEIQSKVSETQQLFSMELDKETALMSGLIGFMQRDRELQHAWMTKDRDALLEYSKKLFDRILSEHRVTHFYFTGTDQICFLRVHNPPRHGDYIDRATTDRAVSEQKPSSGIELGPYGTFTLRVVRPWQIGGVTAGYIELGMEIGHIKTDELPDILDVGLIYTVDKSFLERESWEEGMKMIKHPGDWEQFPRFVVTNTTLPKIPPELSKYLSRLESFDEDEHFSSVIKTSGGNRKYRCAFVPLIDTEDRHVGDIVVVADVTKTHSAIRVSIINSAMVCLVIFAILFILFHFFLSGIEKKLAETRNHLKQEIEDRKRTEKALREEKG